MSDDERITLLPCPFCGDDSPELMDVGADEFAVVCSCCGAQGPAARVGCRDEDDIDLESEAETDWNKRPPLLRVVRNEPPP